MLNIWKTKVRSTKTFVYFNCFHSFQTFKVSQLKIKDTLSSLRKFWVKENPSKVTKKYFLFPLKSSLCSKDL